MRSLSGEFSAHAFYCRVHLREWSAMSDFLGHSSVEKATFTSITAPMITIAASNIPSINIAILITHTITTPGIITATRTAAMITTATTGSNGEGQRRDRGGT